ncbi:MAG TPA: hypothetical protein VF150_04940, partial [Thermoanaerobaculia bacterium]
EKWPHDKAPVAVSLSSLAYLWSLVGDRAEARRAIDQTLLHLGDLGRPYPPLYKDSVHLSLGFSLLEAREPERAVHHAEQALEAVLELGRVPCHEHKIALYLAGEAALDAGHEESGWHYLSHLQRNYYCGWEDLRDLLLAVRTSGMVNWLA